MREKASDNFYLHCSFVVPSIDVMDLVVSEVLPCISASKAVFFNLVLLKH